MLLHSLCLEVGGIRPQNLYLKNTELWSLLSQSRDNEHTNKHKMQLVPQIIGPSNVGPHWDRNPEQV